MSCGKYVIYHQQDSADDFVFVYIRLMNWVNGKWHTDFWAEEAFLIPIGLVSKGYQWSEGQTVDPYTQDTYPGLSDALDGTDGVAGIGCSPFKLKPGTRSECNPSQYSPIVPYVLAQLWVWTENGWCFQAGRRNW
jgi:hypothetical protein